jgi:hypothetical protein
MLSEYETVTVRRGDPEVERRTHMALLNCERCLDAVGLAWQVDGELVNRCYDCGIQEQDDRAERAEQAEADSSD